ncbi:hypothetical protein AABM34_11705 [Lysinibacillus fusiformis]
MDIAYTAIPSLSVEQMYIIYSMVSLHLWKLKRVKYLAIGQFFHERRVPSIAAGNISPNMSLDTDPIMEPNNHGNVLFTEYEDNTAKASYTEQDWIFYRKENEDGHLFRPQKLPDQ